MGILCRSNQDECVRRIRVTAPLFWKNLAIIRSPRELRRAIHKLLIGRIFSNQTSSDGEDDFGYGVLHGLMWPIHKKWVVHFRYYCCGLSLRASLKVTLEQCSTILRTWCHSYTYRTTAPIQTLLLYSIVV